VSDFLDMMNGAFAESVGIFGATDFCIERHKFAGDVDLFDGDKTLIGGSDGGGGWSGTYAGTIVAAKAQFAGKFAAPLEHTLDGKRLEISGRKFRVGRVIEDAISLTLHLENPNAARK
jgi:hypothetical protein